MVHEDPDNIGYWFETDHTQRPPDSMIGCNAIVSRDDQECIALAAFCCHQGYPGAAEMARRDANYHALDLRSDADTAGRLRL
jgi:hypothetical protein